MRTELARRFAEAAALAALYVAAGRLGLMLDAISGFATLVWPPAGIALAALLLRGRGIWPGVTAGALVVNLWAGAPVAVAAGIAAGNTLEALAAVWALQRIPGFRPSLDRIQDVLGLIVLAAGASCVIGATAGTTSLLLGGVITPDRMAVTWGAWWMGDAIGDLIVAPAVLVWGAAAAAPTRARSGETVALAAVLVGVALFTFGGPPAGPAVTYLQPYLLAPPLIWAALRLQQRGAATALFVVATLAVWGTVTGSGPFHDGPLAQRLFGLQAFMALLAPALLVLGAVSAERARVEAQLRRARDAAEAGSHAKSRFLAVMSHELRTPLTGIVGYADLLEAGVGGTLSGQQGEYVARIKRAAWHLVSVIDGILSFSRAEAGRDELRLERVDALQLASDSVALIEPQARTKGLKVRLAALEPEIPMLTDAGKLRQILLNLLGNAVKFADRGTIDLTLDREDGWVVLRIADSGPGIPAEQLERIFEPFAQLEPHDRGGTGLGLSVSRTFARLLGGEVSVESDVGRGSTFLVRLPARAPQRTAAVNAGD